MKPPFYINTIESISLIYTGALGKFTIFKDDLIYFNIYDNGTIEFKVKASANIRKDNEFCSSNPFKQICEDQNISIITILFSNGIIRVLDLCFDAFPSSYLDDPFLFTKNRNQYSYIEESGDLIVTIREALST